MKTNLRNEKGITLVALVVTIIVLLILAGVSLSLVAGGNGILDRSTRAVSETNYSSAKEQAELLIAEKQTEYYEKKYVNNESVTATVGAYVSTEIGASSSTADYIVAISGTKITVTNKNGVTMATGTYDVDTAKVTGWTQPSV